ncbi:hypothetical protein [uncultured Mucilaginibacter sp.]|uniref:hypothetical protein n=1 Tax=uncultured Mucilaginibacter sp. TaxID=797541 RepID=UPI0026350132|nr:hypothetical protein [uncultured Mucilaginibacter sp.]
MKNLAILLLSTFSLCASAQTRTKTSTYKTDDTKQSVSDDGKTMHIMIKSSRAGKDVKYDHTFLVSGMSQNQKDALLKRVNDSLGISPPPPPPAHH